MLAFKSGTWAWVSRVRKSVLWLRRRARWAVFDIVHNVDTTAVGTEKLRGKPGNYSYDLTAWNVLPKIMRNAMLPANSVIFIDVGCGKGKILLSAMRFPFLKIVGIEFSLSLCEVARTNLRKSRFISRRCMNAEVICMDAAVYRLPPGPLILFFYNPFSFPVMKRVLENAVESYRASPRPIFMIFHGASSMIAAIENFLRGNGHATVLQRGAARLGGRSTYVYEMRPMKNSYQRLPPVSGGGASSQPGELRGAR